MKVHAYARIYQGGRESTRTKDLVDLVRLPAPPPAWAKPFRRLAGEVGIPSDLASGHTDAAALLDPVLSEVAMQGSWDSKQRRWVGEGGH